MTVSLPPPSAPLAVTMGDPAGVGPDIIATWLRAADEEARRGVCLLGPALWCQQLAEAYGVAVAPVRGSESFHATPGEPSSAGALLAWRAMEEAAAGCTAGRYAGVVTAPVSKRELVAVGYPHPGQTEFFAAAWGGEPTMAFVGAKLRVVLATWHVPLRAVPAALTEEVLARAVERADRLARALGVSNPRIAVCGLNPHAGEEGLLGTEERDSLDPWLDGLRERFPGVSPCLPGDTVFWRCARGEFDVAVALYHDQGLAPLKLLEFDQAVNVTLGLPYVRTSPDHGTAFALAGTGKAEAGSFAAAVDVARRLASGSRACVPREVSAS